MELLVVIVLVGGMAVYFMGGAIWLWLALLIAACVVGQRAYRVKCKGCGEKVLTGLQMKFCNQCGTEQKTERGVRLRCEECHGLTRSELNLLFCNRCGLKIESDKTN